ncbi:uncharacterized protein N7484_000592 [Penicillium longicatenatum]|uniref:uncharacterized protein n=1 Tax=Penicillium longicatenatum TaxID=1561947 RepID=UPI0025488C8F|nr:uncharacterized protein N7484_000592 [Penicillium longicatenatum]KAJ5661220.1 hypothetical protein N7484_000592 [Penicillium longicatenatum]
MDSKSSPLIDAHAGSEILSEMDNRPSPRAEDNLDLSPSTVFGPACRQFIDADTCSEIRSYSIEFSTILAAVLQGIRVYRRI